MLQDRGVCHRDSGHEEAGGDAGRGGEVDLPFSEKRVDDNYILLVETKDEAFRLTV